MVDVLEGSKPTAESLTDVEDGESESKPTPVPESDDDESEPSEGSGSELGSGEYPCTMYYVMILYAAAEQTEVPGFSTCSCQDGWLSPRMKFILSSTYIPIFHGPCAAHLPYDKPLLGSPLT